MQRQISEPNYRVLILDTENFYQAWNSINSSQHPVKVLNKDLTITYAAFPIICSIIFDSYVTRNFPLQFVHRSPNCFNPLTSTSDQLTKKIKCLFSKSLLRGTDSRRRYLQTNLTTLTQKNIHGLLSILVELSLHVLDVFIGFCLEFGGGIAAGSACFVWQRTGLENIWIDWCI